MSGSGRRPTWTKSRTGSGSLRQGSHTCRTLQAAWSTHGPDSLTFEECERLDDEETAYIRDALLKERTLHWRKELGAEAV
jgi:hypothetical protein